MAGNWGPCLFWSFGHVDLDRVALVLEDGSEISYWRLDDLSEDWRGRILAANGAGTGIAALEFDVSLQAIAAYLGCLRAGVPVLISEPGKLGPDSATMRIWRPEIHIQASDGELGIHVATPGPEAPPPDPELAVLLSTSGSTGDPKLVRLSKDNIASNATAITEYLAIRPTDRAAVTLPFFYSYGLSVLNSYLAAGASLLLTTRSVTEDGFWSAAEAAGVTSLALVPHQCETILQRVEAGRPLPDLRYVTQAGGRLAVPMVTRLAAAGRQQGWDLVVMYGQTEAAPRISYVPPDRLPGAADTIGQAIPGGRIWLADADGRPIEGPGTAGELVYGGPNVMLGYAESRADLARGRDVAELRTGDIAERTAEGFFRIVGRSKRFVKLFGKRLNLDQIEAYLAGNDLPAQALAADDRLVLLHHHEDQGPQLAGLVADAYDLPVAEVHVAHLDRVPLLSSGKTDRQKLQEIAGEVIARDEARALETALDIPALMREATRSRQVGPNDSYSSLGGDSLGYLRIQISLEKVIGAVPRGWERMPIRELEAYARRAIRRKDRPASRIEADVILRIFAISLVVVQHTTTWPLEGGTWILVLLMGLTAARFQMESIVSGRPGRLLLTMLYPILPLYYGIVIAFALFEEPISSSYFLLTRNYDPLTETHIVGVYWFVALYVQIVLVLALLSCAGPLRQKMRANQWDTAVSLFSLSILVAALAHIFAPKTEVMMFGHPMILDGFPALHIPEQGFFECLPIFFSGWILAVADTRRQRRAALGLSIMALLFFSLVASYASSVIFLMLALVFAWSRIEIPAPLWLAQSARKVASVSLFVYLTHMVLVYLMVNMFHGWDRIGQGASALIVLTGAIGLALVLEHGFTLVERALRRLRDAWRG